MSLQMLTGWHWLIFSVVFFIIGFGTRIVVIKAVACGALAVALIYSLMPITGIAQGVLLIITTLAAWMFWSMALQPPSSQNTTNRMAKQSASLIGERASLVTPIKGRYGRVQLKDALWTVTCDEYVPQGQVVEVVGHTGAVLHVVQAKAA